MRPTLIVLVLFTALSLQPALATGPAATGDDEISSIVKALQAPQHDAAARRAALTRLAGLGSRARAALPQVILTLRDPDEMVKVAGAEALSQILMSGTGSGLGDEQAAAAVPTLSGALSDPREEVRAAAAALLALLGERAAPAVAPLTAALSDPNPSVRGSACSALGGIGVAARSALDRLHEVAMVDPKATVRSLASAAAEALRKTGPVPDALDESAVGGLAAKLGSPNPEERLVAVRSLMYLAVRVPRAAMLLREAAASDADPRVRRAASESLFRSGHDVVTAQPVPSVSPPAAVTPAPVDSPVTVQSCMRDLASASELTRLKAVKDLSRMGTAAAEALPLLRKLAIADVDDDVRRVADDAVRRISGAGGPSVESLIAALRDPDAAARLMAAKALGKMGQQALSATDELTRIVQSDPDPDVKRVATSALSQISGRPVMQGEAARLVGTWFGRFAMARVPFTNTVVYRADGSCSSRGQTPWGIAWDDQGGHWKYDPPNLVIQFSGQDDSIGTVEWHSEDSFTFHRGNVSVTYERVLRR